ncbi:MAG: bile acid:sodium symporter family protein [Saprospiraceae bacterium]|nr:bile acid:sodium symporter family protein [Saprospiraceae bacterium]
MTDIDQIRINFNEETLGLLNFCLAFLTFAVSLDISINDFKNVFSHPKKVLVGLTSQWVLMPIFTILLILLFKPAPSIALGMILVSSCPGGNVSNYATHIAKGNTALSVTLTSFVTLMAILVTPISFSLVSKLLPETNELLTKISLNPLSVVWTIVQLIILPLIIGLSLNHYKPLWAAKIRKGVKITSMVIFLGIIVAAVLANIDNIVKYIYLVFLLVLLHNGLAYAMGYYFAKANKLPEADRRTVAIETGIQNAGLGLVLIFNFFPELGGMMLVAAFWGVWDLVTVFALAKWWERRDPVFFA